MRECDNMAAALLDLVYLGFIWVVYCIEMVSKRHVAIRESIGPFANMVVFACLS